MKTVYAIDPGNERSAYVILADGRPAEFGKILNDALLVELQTWNPNNLLAIERIASYGMAVGKEVFETCEWIGRYMQAWESMGGQVKLVYRRDVKLHHCESIRASDSNIRAALIDRYGPGKSAAIGTKANPGPLYRIRADVWSALALGLTAAQ